MARGDNELTRRAAGFWAVGVIATLLCLTPLAAQGASFTAKDLQVLGRAIAFMQPPPAQDAVIAIAYVAGNLASRQDAKYPDQDESDRNSQIQNICYMAAYYNHNGSGRFRLAQTDRGV